MVSCWKHLFRETLYVLDPQRTSTGSLIWGEFPRASGMLTTCSWLSSLPLNTAYMKRAVWSSTCSKREQQQSAEATGLKHSPFKQETTSDKMTFQLRSLPSPLWLTQIPHCSVAHPWGHVNGKGFWEHQSINRRNMVLKGTSGLTRMKVPRTNKLHLFKGQVISNMLFQKQTGKKSTKKLVSKMSPWLPAMLQGLFFLQRRSGKLTNLGIYYQDENFEYKFFTVAKKSAFRGKKYGKKCQSAP